MMVKSGLEKIPKFQNNFFLKYNSDEIIPSFCKCSILLGLFKLADRMRSMRTNGASKNRDYSSFLSVSKLF